MALQRCRPIFLSLHTTWSPTWQEAAGICLSSVEVGVPESSPSMVSERKESFDFVSYWRFFITSSCNIDVELCLPLCIYEIHIHNISHLIIELQYRLVYIYIFHTFGVLRVIRFFVRLLGRFGSKNWNLRSKNCWKNNVPMHRSMVVRRRVFYEILEKVEGSVFFWGGFYGCP